MRLGANGGDFYHSIRFKLGDEFETFFMHGQPDVNGGWTCQIVSSRDAFSSHQSHVVSRPNNLSSATLRLESACSGDTVMGKLILEKDWSTTAFGSVTSWPQSLLTALSIIVNSTFAFIIFWDSEHRSVIYNDAYIPIFSKKHPGVLGQRGDEAWGEVYEVIGPMLDQVFTTGEATFTEDGLLILERNGYVEECYFTWSYSPIQREDGKVGGVLTPIVETTQRVLNERRLNALSDFGARAATIRDEAEACHVASQTFGHINADLTFTLTYMLSGDGTHLKLAGSSNVPDNVTWAPSEISLEALDSPWPVTEGLQSSSLLILREANQTLGPLPGGLWPESATDVVLVPLSKSGTQDHEAMGVLIAGLNPRRAFDDYYRQFIGLCQQQLVNAISSARSLQEEKKRAESLAELDRAKVNFFQNVSHELRTPLTLILGPLGQALSNGQLTRTDQKGLDLSYRNAMRLLRLVNSLLDYSRVEAGRMKARYRAIDVSTITRDLASMFDSALATAQMTYTVQIDDLDASKTFVDPDMWEKIVLNILSNAFKYTLQGGIKVFLKDREDAFCLVVQDTGIGVAEQEIPRLFDRFHRVEHAEGRSHEGTGIGLALCLELVKLHGGKINVDSKLGAGSCFTVTIPYGYAHLPEEQVDLSDRTTGTVSDLGKNYVDEALSWCHAEGSANVEGRRRDIVYEAMESEPRDADADKPFVLVADDNAGMRQYIVSLLSPLYNVKVALDGLEALEMMEERIPSLLVTDIMMPRLDGFGLLSRVRANPRLSNVSVILLSARAGEEAKVEGLRAGADDYIVKPFSANELLVRVKAHLSVGIQRAEMERLVSERTAALSASEERYRWLAELSPVGMAQIDHNGLWVWANERFSALCGAVPDIQSFIERIHPDDRLQVRGLLTSDQDLRQVDARLLAGTETIYLSVSSKLLPRVDDKWHSSHLVALYDITEQKRAESRRAELAEISLAKEISRAEAANEMRRNQELFIDMICHEIRNPLNGIINNTDLLRENLASRIRLSRSVRGLDGEQTSMMKNLLDYDLESITAIDICTSHQKKITDDVLNLSKLVQTGGVSNHALPCQPEHVVIRVMQMFRAESRIKNVTLEGFVRSDNETRELFPGTDAPWLLLDQDRISQILLNLVGNALKFIANSSTRRIQIIVEYAKDAFSFTVGDSGIGMTEAEQNAVFHRWHQANDRTSRDFGGSGLGLYLCRELVKVMNGTISVHSQKSVGSQFKVTIPSELVSVGVTKRRLEEQNGTNISKLSRSSPVHDQKLAVLVVEDNPVNQRVLVRQLERAGYDVEVADDGSQAVEMTMQRYYNIVLMDLEMPIMDGLEATTIIRARELENRETQPLPIVAVSGNARQAYVDQGKSVGLDDFIFKPYTKTDLLEKIRHYMRLEKS